MNSYYSIYKENALIIESLKYKPIIKNTNVLWEDNKKTILSNRFIIPIILHQKIFKNGIIHQKDEEALKIEFRLSIFLSISKK